MACCKCCCGGVDCTEGQQGKCCCGGSSGTCCSASEYCCNGVCQGSPCGCGALLITYDWTATGQGDLDTGTSFLGGTVGFDCGAGNPYLTWGGDDTGGLASETATVAFMQALADGQWSGSATIGLAAGWFSGGSGNITVRVRCSDDTTGVTEQTQTATPGSQTGCASTSVGSVTVYSDGTWTLLP